MINILKVAGILQTIPTIATLKEKSKSPEKVEPNQTYMRSDLFGGRSPKNQGSRKQSVEKGASGQEGKGGIRRGNNKKDDNDDNNSGGLLEPIIEDLEGFIRGRRAPLPTY